MKKVTFVKKEECWSPKGDAYWFNVDSEQYMFVDNGGCHTTYKCTHGFIDLCRDQEIKDLLFDAFKDLYFD